MLEYAILLSLLLIALTLLYKWSVSSFGVWKRKGVPYDSDNLYPFVGNMKATFTRGTHIAYLIDDLYNKFKDTSEFAGFYATLQPTFIPLSAEMSCAIAIKDFSHFPDRDFHNDPNFDVLMNNISTISGPDWKYQRTKLSPTFTSGKLRGMTVAINDSCDMFINYMKKNYSGKEVDTESLIQDCIMCFIGKVVCGMNYYDIENPDPVFKKICSTFSQPSWRLSFRMILQFISPKLAIKMKFFPPYVENYFRELTVESMKAKARTQGDTKDFLQLLINLHKEDEMNNDKEGHFSMNAVIGNLFVFLLAGQETSTQAVTMLLYNLSKHPDVKHKLAKEIDTVLTTVPHELSYDDAMKKFPYLNQVLEESMRLYPLIFALNRICTKEYTVPGTDITIDVGTSVIIPVTALHRDARYWTDPDKFDPERFSPENKERIVPGSYVPFGLGPRMCIGNRLALLDMKILLIKLLHSFDVSPTERTPKEIKYDHKQPTQLKSVDKIYLQFTPRLSLLR
uniref:Probable cytochrome P450 6a14 n=1 Tax=Cacopsylla melanoneura TaxID=428564 RepID=A0A8D8Q5Q5_9HEMI